MQVANITRRAALGSLAALALAIVGFGGEAAADTQLTVYTALEADQLKEYKEAFEADNPGIVINWVRDSTGIVTAKLLAEKDNPQADVIWGLAATSLMLMKGEGMLEPYAPKGLDQVTPLFRDPDATPSWVGMDAWMSAIAVNKVESEARKLPMPASWADLTKPDYKGALVMPNPASSGTGFLMVSAWLQLMGEEKGWQFMDALHENMAAYTHSGSKPAKMAAAGEYPMGISFAYRIVTEKNKGAPLDVVYPAEGLGWDMEATAIVKGTENLDAAKALVDWSITEKANRMYNKGYAIVALPGVAQPIEHFPAEPEKLLIKNDFEWAAKNRERILAEWQKRYDGKSEPKS